MKSIHYISIFIILGTLIIFSSCNDKEDTEAPVVAIISPQNNETFSVGDTINIHFEVTENDELHHIIAHLTDEADTKLWNRNKHDHSQFFTWQDQYIVNPSEAGKTLLLTVTADDHNGNEAAEMVSVTIE